MVKSRRPLRLLAIPITLVGLTATGLVSPAESAPATVKCGTVITQSTTLTANVGPCSRGGLVVGTDNITLDLGGFAVIGRSNRTGDGVGILLNGRTGVTVRNGRVTDYDAGVAIVGGSANTVTGLLAKDNIGTTKRGDFGDGIVISGSDSNTVVANNVVHNGPFSGMALVGDSNNNLLEDNVISDNNIGFTGLDGVRVEGPGANNNRVRGNTVAGNTLDGIAIFADGGTGNFNTGNIIEENTVVSNGFGLLAVRPGDGIRLFLRANNNTVRNNHVRDNAGSGILLQFSSGLQTGALNNSITGNTAQGNGRASTARFDLEDQNPNCDNNVWSGNTFGTASQACVES